jgi:predicted RNase H-like HicB family nuclease
MAEVLFSLKLPCKITKCEKWFLATCPILDVHSQGETEKKAKKNLIEALFLFSISCFERGTLDTVLKDCGFRPHKITFCTSQAM